MAKRELTNRERKIGKMHGRVVHVSKRLLARYRRGILDFLGKKRRKAAHFGLLDLADALKVKQHGRNAQLHTFFSALKRLEEDGLVEEYGHPADSGMKAYRLKPSPHENAPYEERPD